MSPFAPPREPVDVAPFEKKGSWPRRCKGQGCNQKLGRGNRSGYCRVCYGRFVLFNAGVQARNIRRGKL